MRKWILVGMVFFFWATACQNQTKETVNEAEKIALQTNKKRDFALVVHGGAGTMSKETITEEKYKAYDLFLREILEDGKQLLSQGTSSLDVVESIITKMEDSPLFNAGKGAVFTHHETNELDASIMDGSNMKAGAVGGISIIKNPIKAARIVMDRSKHVFLSGKGAEAFAKMNNLDTVPNTYFRTEGRWNSIQRILEQEKMGTLIPEEQSKYGTVGVVALDKNGNIAAGTSTGGMTNKKWNRIGDSPIIGAGTYANNATCGISCTGHGEYFIRYAVAHDVSAQMEYGQKNLAEAAHYIINDKLVEAGGTGGLIGIDFLGNIAMPFNTKGMYRGYVLPGEAPIVGIFETLK